MKVYVAAKFDEKDKVKKAHDLLKEKGHEITVDWTLHKLIKPYVENVDLARKYSERDMNGVKECDVFILFTDNKKTNTGMYVELGAAIFSNVTIGKPKIFVIGEDTTYGVFFFHPAVIHKKTIEEVLAEL